MGRLYTSERLSWTSSRPMRTIDAAHDGDELPRRGHGSNGPILFSFYVVCDAGTCPARGDVRRLEGTIRPGRVPFDARWASASIARLTYSTREFHSRRKADLYLTK